MEVCKRNGEGTFAGTHGNGRDAPIPAFRGAAMEPQVRPKETYREFGDCHPKTVVSPSEPTSVIWVVSLESIADFPAA
jgi:hypothetical protein